MPSKPPRIFDRSFGYGEVSNAHDDLMFATALRLLDKSIRWIARSLRIEQVSLLVRTGDQYELARATAASRLCRRTAVCLDFSAWNRREHWI